MTRAWSNYTKANQLQILFTFYFNYISKMFKSMTTTTDVLCRASKKEGIFFSALVRNTIFFISKVLVYVVSQRHIEYRINNMRNGYEYSFDYVSRCHNSDLIFNLCETVLYRFIRHWKKMLINCNYMK